MTICIAMRTEFFLDEACELDMVMELHADFGLKFHNPLSRSINTAYTREYRFMEVDCHYVADNFP